MNYVGYVYKCVNVFNEKSIYWDNNRIIRRT